MSYCYAHIFPAMRGIQAKNEYYVAMCPLNILPKLFLFNEVSLPPELRAQRTLNTSRIPELKKYVIDNSTDYAFSAITASIDGDVKFEAVNIGDETSDVGRLIVPMSARVVINDGQHRRAAIEEALKEKPELGIETIAVVFYRDEGLKRSQQLFADLNKHAVKPTKSLGILYDNRDPLACLARDLADTIPCFKNLTEKEKTTISNRSHNLFTLSGIYQATGALLGKRKNQAISKSEREFAFSYWNELMKVIPQWNQVARNEVKSFEIRTEYVHVHNILIQALGLIGHALSIETPNDWITRVQTLKNVDWSRSNTKVWEGRAMVGGAMSKSKRSVTLTTVYLKKLLGLPLTTSEEKTEKRFLTAS